MIMDKNETETVTAAPEAPQNVLQTSMAGLAIFVVVLIFVISCRQCMKPCGATKEEKDAERTRQAKKRSASRKLEESKDLRSSLESIQSLT